MEENKITSGTGKLARILVVEDDPVNRRILCNIVEKMGFEADEATNGLTALTLIVKNKPDLILLDVMMDGLDGYEVCQRIKADHETASIPVIFISALREERNEERGLSLGAVDYISKPFRTIIVQARIKSHLELKRHRDQLEEIVLERSKKLQEALKTLKTLKGLLPICSACKKIRDDKGYWNRLEDYIEHHSEAEFSHGICPGCAKKMNPEIYDDLV